MRVKNYGLRCQPEEQLARDPLHREIIENDKG